MSWATAWNSIRTAAQNVGPGTVAGNNTKVLVRGACTTANDIRIQGTDLWFQADTAVTLTRSGGINPDAIRIVGPSTRVMIDGKNQNTKFVLMPGGAQKYNAGLLT